MEGMLEFWSTQRHGFDAIQRPPSVKWTSKMDTDLYCLLKDKTHAVSLAFSPNGGRLLACFGADRKVSSPFVQIFSIPIKLHF